MHPDGCSRRDRPVSYCVLDFCPSKFGDPVSFHKFPRDEAQRNAWIEFVRATGRHFWTPGKSSMLCSLHFSSDAYESKYAVSFGIAKKRWLVSGAVPTVYPAAARSLLPSESGATSPKRQCVAEVGSDGVDLCEKTAIKETSSSTGLKKKVQAVSWPWGCGVIEKWATCIINHFYFSVRTAAARVTTAERRDELAVAIWVSLLNHIQKKHYDHSEEYANCEHGDLLPRKWIFPGAFPSSPVTFHLIHRDMF
ncbi:hypothetical protein HPB49_012074 [Dermacentor silvarum]|uniref:Uncharacterized protein n=1 Tax=Dermacentor silvarum TaxID=543639 RepID=A0ACB8CEZ9_DERSI|nr:hypothetical protein HPB49_012074 [Dermacentor silvarum]